MLTIYVFLIGTAIGSFLNVLIDRLPHEKSIMGRSQCDHCRRTLTVIDLFPIISFVILRGKCRTCKKTLSIQYPLVELLTGVCFALVWAIGYQQPVWWETSYDMVWRSVLIPISYMFIASSLIVMLVADFKYQIIPDEMQILLILAAGLLKIALGNPLQIIFFSVVEGVAVFLPIFLIYLITKGKGMGFGDVKLAFGMGFFLGIKSGLLALYFGFIFGAVYGTILILLKKKKMKSKIAFGPFLILGIVVVVFCKRLLYDFLLRTYGI